MSLVVVAGNKFLNRLLEYARSVAKQQNDADIFNDIIISEDNKERVFEKSRRLSMTVCDEYRFGKG